MKIQVDIPKDINKKLKIHKELHNYPNLQKSVVKILDESQSLKNLARNLARREIKISKDQLCEDCNINKAAQRHHEDYNKPLVVKLLCIPCHVKRHIKCIEKYPENWKFPISIRADKEELEKIDELRKGTTRSIILQRMIKTILKSKELIKEVFGE